MKLEAVAAKRSKTHTRYYSASGKLLPGVTTVLGVLAKPALIPWANNLGLQGIKVGAYVDALAEVGTITHDLILCHLSGDKFDSSCHAPDMIEKADSCFRKYLEWERKHSVVAIHCGKTPLVSSRHGYGGTHDFFGTVDGRVTLADFKTSGAIWPEHRYQLAAYRQLLNENGFMVENAGILRIGRDETEGFEDQWWKDTTRELEIFMCALKLYQLGVGK